MDIPQVSIVSAIGYMYNGVILSKGNRSVPVSYRSTPAGPSRLTLKGLEHLPMQHVGLVGNGYFIVTIFGLHYNFATPMLGMYGFGC